MDSKKSFQSVYSEICNQREDGVFGNDHRLVYLNTIRKHYPNHYVVAVDPEANAEFMDFAEAGFAKATLDTEDDHIDKQRKFKAPRGGRVYHQKGVLVDRVFFGKYKYEWKDNEFVLYHTTFKDFYNRDHEWNFVCYPRAFSEASETGAADCPEIDALLLELGNWSSIPHKDIYVFDGGYVYRSRSTWESIKDASWDDVVMYPVTKSQLMKDILGFFSTATRDLYLKYQIPYKRGILLHGLPGNGKTSTIRALIAHLMRGSEPVPTLYVKSTTDKCNGDQASIKRIFEHARTMAPCCVVLEDLDSLVNDAKVRSYFLNEMDGLEANDGILIIGSTNHLDDIDEAIRSRPSRFDRKYAFGIPNRAERELYAKYWLNKLKDNEDIDFKEEMCAIVADLTPDFSYAFLKELFVSSLVMVARQAIGEEIDWDVINPASAKGSTKGDETPKDADDTAPAQSSGENDSSDGSTEKTNAETKEKEKQVETRKKREIPKVDVPEPLKDNTFFKLIHLNVGLLLQNMDDNDKAEEKSKQKKKSQDSETDDCNRDACATCK
jgi:transitional endoplasmic reticulum ATPase